MSDWIEESNNAEIDYRNNSLDPVKTYNFVYSVMNASVLSTDTDQANEANRITMYLVNTRNAIEEWKEQNTTLTERVANLTEALETISFMENSERIQDVAQHALKDNKENK